MPPTTITRNTRGATATPRARARTQQLKARRTANGPPRKTAAKLQGTAAANAPRTRARKRAAAHSSTAAARTATAVLEPITESRQLPEEDLPAAPPPRPSVEWRRAPDGDWYPPESLLPGARWLTADASAATARMMALRPWYQRKRFILLLGLTAVVVMAVALTGGGSEPAAGRDGSGSPAQAGPAPQAEPPIDVRHPPVADVNVTRCATDQLGFVLAGGEILNHTAKPSDYMIRVAFADGAGVSFASAFTVVSDVEPGQPATWEANGIEAPPAGVTVACRLTQVTRFAS